MPYVQFNESRIAYRRYGNGPQALLCLHGYGESGQSFEFLISSLPAGFSLIAPDLPFHGETIWKEGLDITREQLEAAFSQILVEEGFSPIHMNPSIRILAYSLGGRITLSLYERYPKMIEKMILVAPDGIRVNFWYWLASQTWLGNKVFFFTMRNPQWFFFFLKAFHKLKWLNSSIYRFILHYLENPHLREELYQRWTSLRKVRPQIPIVKRNIRQQQTSVHLFYGQYDRIIVPKTGRDFQKGLTPYVDMEVLPSGHNLLKEKYLTAFLKALID